MKKVKYVMLALLAIAFGLTSMTSNNAEYSAGKAGSNGSPGEGTCASGSCHNSFELNSGPGSVSIDIIGLGAGNTYVQGQNYQVSVTVSQSGFGLFGFGLEALQSSGANAGLFTPGSGSHIMNATVAGNSRATVAHLDNSGFSTGSRTWSFSWTAPSAPIPVTFYAAGNAANSNNGDGGDYIYTTSLEVMPAPALEAPSIQYEGSLVICEGESTTLGVASQPGIAYSWQNSQGVVVGSNSTLVASQSDCYTVTASDGVNSATSEPVCVTVEIVNSSFSGLAPMYCIGDGPVTLIPEVEGGVFSGQGVVGNIFNPSQLPVGDFMVGYTVITPAGCEFTQTEAVSISQILPADFVDLDDVYCTTDNSIQLNPVTEDGDFTGPVVLGVFNPDIAPGVYDITYTTGSGVCSASVTQTVEVLESLSSEFYLFPAFCSTSSAEQIIPEVPGGEFTGTGVAGDSFNPATAVIGENAVTYTLVQANGCVSTTTEIIEVFDVANSDFSGLESITCITEGLVELVPASAGGVFSGPGVSGLFFDPAVAGVGEHTVIYDIDLGDCQSETAIITTVLAGPDATFTGLMDEYCVDSDMVSELTGMNAGIEFSGPGMSGNTFDAAAAGVGVHTITSSYTDVNGCSATSQQNVTVNALPIADVAVSGDLASVTAVEQGATYQWWNCDTQTAVTGATESEFSITDASQNGNYSVAVTLNGCAAMSDCVALLLQSTDDVFDAVEMNLFPNPASVDLHIETEAAVMIDIINGQGALMLTRNSSGGFFTIDVSVLPSGIYQVIVREANRIFSKTLLIQR